MQRLTLAGFLMLTTACTEVAAVGEHCGGFSEPRLDCASDAVCCLVEPDAPDAGGVCYEVEVGCPEDTDG